MRGLYDLGMNLHVKIVVWGLVGLIAEPVFGAGGVNSGVGGGGAGEGGLWSLFQQSFDLFTVVLLVASLTAATVIVRNLIELRPKRLLPDAIEQRVRDLAREGKWAELSALVESDESVLGRSLKRVMSRAHADREGLRNQAELVFSEESALLFRKTELLSLIGNLAPLVGLAGTVWGMILAFSSLGAVGGQAGPADLSLGISKALFHTLAGLVVAVPCLLTHGLLRSMLDRVCTRAMVIGASVVEGLEVESLAGVDDDTRAA